MSRGPFYAPGNYSAVVEDIGFAVTKQTSKDMIVIRTKVLGTLTNADASPQDYHPAVAEYTRTINLVLNDEKSYDYILRKLRYAGWTGSDFSTISELDSCLVKLVCKHESDRENPGQQREQWDLMLPPRQGVPLAAGGEQAMRLNALFGSRLADPAFAVAQHPEPVGAPREPNRAEGEADDSEIPF